MAITWTPLQDLPCVDRYNITLCQVGNTMTTDFLGFLNITFLVQDETGQCPVRRSVAVTVDSSVLVAASTQLQECSHYTLTILPRHPNTQVAIFLHKEVSTNTKTR